MFSFILFACAMLATVSSGLVRRYNETIVYQAATIKPDWSVYDRRARTGNKTKMNDDQRDFFPLDICVPFFQSTKPLPMYFSSNGFVAPYPENPCEFYCSNAQHFTSDPQSGGSPMIGLYVSDLNPSDRDVWRWRGQKIVDDEIKEAAIAEYVGVPFYGDSISNLTGQIELWDDGTIILRYEEAYRKASMDERNIPSVGLVWTAKQRYVAPDVSTVVAGGRNIAAIRYDPMPDPCAVNQGCAACAAANGCAWCGAVQECVGTDIIDDVCPPTDRNTCLTPSLNTSESIAQQFYTTSLSYETPFTDISLLPNVTVLSWRELPKTVPLGLNFSFFSSHEEGPNQTNPLTNYSQITVSPDFTLFLGQTSRCGSVLYGLRDGTPSATVQTCWAGAYKNTIALFGAPLAPSNVDPGRAHILRLPERNVGDIMCTVNLTEAGCPPLFVYQMTSIPLSTADRVSRITGQILIHQNGTVELHYNTLVNLTNHDESCANSSLRTTWYRYNSPYAGLFRGGNTDTDPSSVTLPWTLLEAGLRFTATPVPGCLDCGGKGYCNTANRTCICKGNFAGDQCQACAPGFYGPQCLPCAGCANGGTCDDGITGSGFCKECNPPFSGPLCNATCPAETTRSINCTGGCGMGYCECGTCVCLPQSGWYGDRCEHWVDPCRRNTLYGCSACLGSNKENSTVECSWCSSSMMCEASPKQRVHIGNVSGCSSVLTTSDKSECELPTIRAPADSKFAVITVIVVFACLGVCSCLTLLTVCLCRKQPYNPLVLGAVPGVPDFSFPRREREIIGISRLPVQGRHGRPVQGIPLKQIPMRDLVILQRLRQKEREAALCPIENIHVDHNGL